MQAAYDQWRNQDFSLGGLKALAIIFYPPLVAPLLTIVKYARMHYSICIPINTTWWGPQGLRVGHGLRFPVGLTGAGSGSQVVSQVGWTWACPCTEMMGCTWDPCEHLHVYMGIRWVVEHGLAQKKPTWVPCFVSHIHMVIYFTQIKTINESLWEVINAVIQLI